VEADAGAGAGVGAGVGAGGVTQANLRAKAQRQSCKRVPVVKPEESQEEAEKAVGLCET
jgi:hypothetical protein